MIGGIITASSDINASGTVAANALSSTTTMLAGGNVRGASFQCTSLNSIVFDSGTWTPQFNTHSGAISFTYTQAVGSYMRFGTMGFASFALAFSNRVSSASTIEIDGLPLSISYLDNSASQGNFTNFSVAGINSGNPAIGIVFPLLVTSAGSSIYVNVINTSGTVLNFVSSATSQSMRGVIMWG